MITRGYSYYYRFLICAVLIIASTISFSQPCTTFFKKTYGGNGNDDGLDIALTSDSGSVIAGRTTSDAIKTNGFLLKIDAKGVIEWTKSFGYGASSELVKVNQLTDGGFIALGITRPIGQTTYESWMLRTNQLGVPLWSRRISQPGISTKPKYIVPLQDGGFAVALNTNDSTSQSDGIVIRTDASGSILWRKKFDHGGNDGVQSLLEDGNHLIVSGYFTGDYLDAVLMKLSLSDGAVTWAKKFIRGTGLNEQCLRVAKINGGYAFGVLSKLATFNSMGTDPFITLFKMKEDGTVFFQRKANISTSSGYDVGRVDMRLAADSGFVIIINDTLPQQNARIYKVSPLGIPEWSHASNNFYRVNSINGLDEFSEGYLFTGTYREATFPEANSKIQVLKTDVVGYFGVCSSPYLWQFIDTLNYLSIAPFTWASVISEAINADTLTLTTAPLNFVSNLTCEKIECASPPQTIADSCYSTYIYAYGNRRKFIPLNVLNTSFGTILSGYIQFNGNTQPFVIKLRQNGTVAWSRSVGSYIREGYFQFILPTEDGNMLLCGQDGYVINHQGYSGTTMVKMTPNGQVIFSQSIPGSLLDIKRIGGGNFSAILKGYGPVLKIEFGQNGNIYYRKRIAKYDEITPAYRRLLVDGDTYYMAGHNNDYSISLDKYDAQSNRVWKKRFKMNTNKVDIQLLQMIGDSIYLTVKLEKLVGAYYIENIALVKIGKDGGGLNGFLINEPDIIPDFTNHGSIGTNIQFTKTIDNNFVFSGQVVSGPDTALGIIKFSGTGQIIWAKKYPSLVKHNITSVKDDEGSLLIVGFKRYPFETNSYFGASGNITLLRTNIFGDVVSNSGTACSNIPFACASSTLIITEESINHTQTPNFLDTVITVTPFLPVERMFSISNTLSCGVPGNCSFINIWGVGEVCTGNNIVTYSIQRNPGCNTPGFWSYDTSAVAVVAITDSTISVKFVRPGFTSLVAKIQSSCGILLDSVLVNVHPAAESLSLGGDKTLCSGNQIILNARAGFATYTWQGGSTDSTFTVTQPGIYHVRVSDFCGQFFSDTINVASHPPIPFSVGPDRTKCNTDTLHLTASPGFLNYTWSNNYQISSLTSQQVVINPLVDTAYYVRGEKTPGCFAYDTIHIRVNQSPAINLGADQSFCSGDSVVLDAGADFITYVWNTGVTARSFVARNIGTFDVVATTTQGCQSRDTFRVLNLFPLPLPAIDPNPELCSGTSRILDPGSFSSYLWQDGSTRRTMSVSSTGTYSVTVTNSNGCKNADTTVITTMLPLPKGFLSQDTSICSYGTLVLKPSAPFSAYLWSIGSASSNVTISQAGSYWLQVRDVKNCVGRDSIVVNLKQCLKGLYVPTAFTPNRDGRNDLLRGLLYGDIKTYEFSIYNRWGQMVYQTKDPQRGWSGKLGAKDQETGVYVWICRYQLAGEAEMLEKGTFVLIR